MAEGINLTVCAKVKNGPTISFSSILNVDAYDKLNVPVITGETKTIQLVPAGTPSVHFLLIKSSHYSDQISYKVNNGGSTITLDSPQSFVGEGSLTALDDAGVPETLVLTNSLPNDIDIQILIGRTAVT